MLANKWISTSKIVELENNESYLKGNITILKDDISKLEKKT